jgi:hypothetical protein
MKSQPKRTIRLRLFWLAVCCIPIPEIAAPSPLPADAHSYRPLTIAELRKGFAAPPLDARPWAIWFWWNSVVSRGEIARELEEVAAAGFGGVELRVATFYGWGGRKLEGMDAASLDRIGHRRLEYLSEEWVDTLAFTCATAERLGLRFSINLGQGWPPGGPWIADRHRTKHLSGEAREFEGPAAFVVEQAPAEGMVLAWRLDTQGGGKVVSGGSFQDLSRFIRRERGLRVLRWEAPLGRWLVGIFSVTPGGLCDKGEGPEVDPASSEAVLFHLNYMFRRLDPKLRRYYGRTLVDVASDSWEYTPKRGGRFWSPAILEAFPRLAGYDLRERLYAVLGYGPDGKQVLHDLEEVERQLVRDNYFVQISRFLHERGLAFRPQIYGRGLKRDLLEAYALVDVPETEQGDYAVPEAVWAARTTGKAIVSNESFTHLHRKMDPIRRPHGEWESNLAAMRGAANYLFGEGINRIQMHSFSYSPPGLPLPGWRMYAELHLNRKVPWWPHIKPLNLWLARQQWLLQAGWPVADALFYPVKSNPDDGPFRRMGDNQPVSAANAVDAANEHTLARIPDACSTGRYAVNNVILLGPLRTVPETESMLALLDCGARILATHSLPDEWPALQSYAAEGIRHRFAKALAEGRILDAHAGGWKTALASIQSVRWTSPEARLMFQHRRVQGADIYLLVNSGDDFAGEVSFPHQSQRVELYDADRGRMLPVVQFAEREGRAYVPLRLPHAESVAFVFTSSPQPLFVTQSSGGEFEYDESARLLGRFRRSGTYQVEFSNGDMRLFSVTVPPPLPVAGPWRLSVSPAQAVSPQAPVSFNVEQLMSWRDLPSLKYYAGRATYRADFHLPKELVRDGVGLILDLGSVFESAEVAVNGADTGIVYTPPYRVDITALVKSGKNVIEVEVANQLKNRLERSDAYLRPSGLLGPVTIIPESRIRIGKP